MGEFEVFIVPFDLIPPLRRWCVPSEASIACLFFFFVAGVFLSVLAISFLFGPGCLVYDVAADLFERRLEEFGSLSTRGL